MGGREDLAEGPTGGEGRPGGARNRGYLRILDFPRLSMEGGSQQPGQTEAVPGENLGEAHLGLPGRGGGDCQGNQMGLFCNALEAR